MIPASAIALPPLQDTHARQPRPQKNLQAAPDKVRCDKALFIVDHVPEPSQLKNDCVKTFIFRKSRRKVKKTVFHLVSSPDVPDFQPLAIKSHSI